MKNKHIKAGQEVPIELRKEVYREALKVIESNKDKSNGFGLCYFLLMVLYGANESRQVYYHQKDLTPFRWHKTPVMFPELKDFVGENYGESKTNNERIEFLKSVI